MPVIQIGGQYGGYADVAHQLETEKTAKAEMINRTLLGYKELEQRRDESEINNYLRMRGLGLQERQQDMREDEMAHGMFMDLVQQRFKEMQEEVRQQQFEREFGMDRAVKEATLGVRYDPSTNEYRSLKPGEGLYDPRHKQPYKPAEFIQDEYYRLRRELETNQREIERITTKLGDVFFTDDKERKRLEVERERRSTEQLGLQRQAELMKSRWQNYIGGPMPEPTKIDLQERPALPEPKGPPPEAKVVPEREMEEGEKLWKTGKINIEDEGPKDETAKSVVKALAAAGKAYDKAQLMSGSMKDYSNDHLTVALESLNNEQVRKRLTDLGLEPKDWENAIKLELRRRGMMR